ncbi:MAG: dissimilatory-type sulfite reductase subunit alpha [Pirellulales bacterium]|nr:dissimilatory-type sulfite reductase subunit alpha [Pirellulales bacterium]
MDDRETPLLDELEEGDWPSFVAELKRAAEKSAMSADLLRQIERSYADNTGHWKRGGIVGVRGYGGGVVGRYSAMPEEFPGVKEFHTLRVNEPAGFYYTTEKLRELCDVWDKYGSGLLNLHGSTGDIILLGTTTENLQPCFDALGEIGFDLGGSGSAMRTLSCCVGQSRCEHACIDTMDVTHDLTMNFQMEIHRPAFPYKFKIKVSGCPNDCAAASARSDLAIIGVWRDAIEIDQQGVAEYVDEGFDLFNRVIRRCPTWALDWDAEEKRLKLTSEDCVHCMHCINEMPKALRVGQERGAAVLIGGKAPVVKGAMIGWVLVPFMRLEPPYQELKDLIVQVTEFWAEHGKNRERLAELIDRLGMPAFLEGIGVEPCPQMVDAPRSNPYLFWREEEVKHA